MNAVEQAIMRTVLYASVFEFALNHEELHRYLISDTPYDFATVVVTLEASSHLESYLHYEAGYVTLRRHPEWIDKRLCREVIAHDLWASAWHYGRWLAHLPFVEMVALTGALSVRNPQHYDDDFDYMLVTKPNRVWLARLFAVVIVKLVRLRGRELCPNYVVARDRLVQAQRDIFIAHELAQMVVIEGDALYEQILQENAWLVDYLPNITIPDGQTALPRRTWWGKRLMEGLLSGQLGDWLERWEYQRKAQKFEREFGQALASEGDESAITPSEVKGHFSGHGHRVRQRYEAYLAEYALEVTSV